MKIVALLRPPADPAAAVALLTEAAGMTAAEARMRLAPEPPALLVRLPPDAADTLVAKLRAAKLAALAIGQVPSGERVVARTLALSAESFTATSRAGESIELPWGEVATVLRGSSSVRDQTECTERSRTLDIAGAAITGGLKVTKTVERTVRSTQEEIEQCLFVFGRDGRSAVLRETQLDFSFLGKDMQPARTANVTALAQRLKASAKSAFYDERLLRLGRRPLPFVLGETHMSTRDASSVRTSTAGGLEVLAEVMHRAVMEKLIS